MPGTLSHTGHQTSNQLCMSSFAIDATVNCVIDAMVDASIDATVIQVGL